MQKNPIDEVKTSITLSMGMKNRLRKLKGSLSYEEYISQLIRQQNQRAHGENYIEQQNLKRKQAVHDAGDFKVIFSYNTYNRSQNYIFDISIDYVRERKKGSRMSFKEFLEDFFAGDDSHRSNYQLYFSLLEEAIRKEIEPLFKHKGRFEDMYQWREEFGWLQLPRKAFENDVEEKLRDYENEAPLQ